MKFMVCFWYQHKISRNMMAYCLFNCVTESEFRIRTILENVKLVVFLKQALILYYQYETFGPCSVQNFSVIEELLLHLHPHLDFEVHTMQSLLCLPLFNLRLPTLFLKSASYILLILWQWIQVLQRVLDNSKLSR